MGDVRKLTESPKKLLISLVYAQKIVSSRKETDEKQRKYKSSSVENKNIKMIQRNSYLSHLIQLRDQDLIKVVTGIRRCGKSTLL